MSRNWIGFVVALAACNGIDDSTTEDCAEADKIRAWADRDGDGWGHDPIDPVCVIGPEQANRGDDCDDENPTANPRGTETCDGADNDCNGSIDNGLPTEDWYPDLDGDGAGDDDGLQPACGAPGPDWSLEAGDCDDTDPNVGPESREICNGRIDDDCDGLLDDQDTSVDPATLVDWYGDNDGDGFGRGDIIQARCEAPSPNWTDQIGDCDDTRADLNPQAPEVCNRRDDNCDGLVDDDDPAVDPAGQSEFFLDADLDGYGDATALTLACDPGPGAVTNNDDCDDNDTNATIPRDWIVDSDADGIGAGNPVGFGCFPPGPGTAPAEAGEDCDDDDSDLFPGNPEVCEDGLDQNCDGQDAGCAEWMYTVRTFDQVLRRLDLFTGTWEDVGPLNVGYDFGDLAYDEGSDTLYMLDGRPLGALYTVDIATGAATLVGAHGLTDLFALTFDPRTDTLYAGSASAFSWYTLDVNTGAPSLIANPGVSLDGLLVDTVRDQIIGITGGGGDLWIMDPISGGATALGSQGFVDDCGLAYDPLGDLYWAIDWAGNLFTFDPNNGYSRTTVDSGLMSHDGLVYIPNPPN